MQLSCTILEQLNVDPIQVDINIQTFIEIQVDPLWKYGLMSTNLYGKTG